MFKRWYVFYILVMAACCLVCAAAPKDSVYATGESYRWLSYGQIGAKLGDYLKINDSTDGDVSALTFIQDKDDPNKFTSNVDKAGCKGIITLTVGATTHDKATVGLPAGCQLLQTVDRQVTINNASSISYYVRADQSSMHDDFLKENCKNNSSDYEQCKTAAERSYNDKIKNCQGQHNYETSPQLADKYLDCVSNALCVERPGREKVKPKEPKDDAAKCTLPNIGWGLCQILQLEAWVTDQSFKLFTSFLEVDPLTEYVVQQAPSSTQPSENNQTTTNPASQPSTGDQASFYCNGTVGNPANAAQGDANTAKIAACKDGYNSGQAGSSTCDKWLNPPEAYNYSSNPAELKAACLDGYQKAQASSGNTQGPEEEETPRNTQLPRTTDNHTVVYTAWKFLLGFTNLAFIAAFMLIIYSYITGWGLSTYNLKMMTPRLIITIFLVNTSFWICAITIDVSNILGKNIQSLMHEITPPQVAGSQYSGWTDITNKTLGTQPTDGQEAEKTTDDSATSTTPANNTQASPDDTLSPQCKAIKEQNEEAAKKEKDEQDQQGEDTPATYKSDTLSQIKFNGKVILGAVVVFALLVVLIPSMTVVLAALVVVLIILILRQAIIIILVMVSAIAFATNVLPGTKQWFSRWWKAFFSVTMLYPAISFIFGAAYLASHVIQDRGLEYDNIFMVMFSLVIQILPFFFLPALMRLGGSVMSKATNMATSDKSPFGKIKALDADRLEGRRIRRIGDAATADMSKFTNKFNPRVHGRRLSARRAASKEVTDHLHKQAVSLYQAQSDKGRRAAAAKLDGHKAQEALEEGAALAAQDAQKITMDKIRANAAELIGTPEQSNAHQAVLRNAALPAAEKAMSDLEEASHVLVALNNATDDKIFELIASSGKMSDTARRVLVDELRKSGFSKRNAQFGGAAMQNIEEGNFNSMQDVHNATVGAVDSGKFSSESLVGQSEATLALLANLKQQGAFSQEGSRDLSTKARRAMGDEKLRGNVTGKREDHLGNLRNMQ